MLRPPRTCLPVYHTVLGTKIESALLEEMIEIEDSPQLGWLFSNHSALIEDASGAKGEMDSLRGDKRIRLASWCDGFSIIR